ncbi:MAG: hypothetical protein JNJ98_10655, partial [Gemmatimonadetes bacterium]|nr:hypothetical protein [Gemmatimonadota bacterium]
MKTRTAVLAITIIACAEPDRRDVGPLEPTSALRAVIPQHAIRRPQEDKFVALAAAVPSFGGYHYERGDLVISLTDPADSARAAALVARDGTGAGGSSHKDGRRTG